MWSLVLAFVAGLAVGVVGCRLVMGRGRSTETPAIAAPTDPEPAAEPSPEESPPEEPSGDPASAVDDVVAELERRVKGRRTEGETDRTTGGRRGRSD